MSKPQILGSLDELYDMGEAAEAQAPVAEVSLVGELDDAGGFTAYEGGAAPINDGSSARLADWQRGVGAPAGQADLPVTERLASRLEHSWLAAVSATHGVRAASNFGAADELEQRAQFWEQNGGDPQQAALFREQAQEMRTSGLGRQIEAEAVRRSMAALPKARAQREWDAIAADESLGTLESYGKQLAHVASNPGVLLDLTAENALQFVPALLTGAIGRALTVGKKVTAGAAVAATAGSAAASSAYLEFGNDYIDLRSEGMAHDEAFRKAATRAGIIGAFDAASLKVVGDAVGKQLRDGFLNKAVDIARETASQLGKGMALGGGGEAVGSLATGRVPDPQALLAEMLAEVPGTALEAGAAALAGAADLQLPAPPVGGGGADPQADAVEVDDALGTEDVETSIAGLDATEPNVEAVELGADTDTVAAAAAPALSTIARQREDAERAEIAAPEHVALGADTDLLAAGARDEIEAPTAEGIEVEDVLPDDWAEGLSDRALVAVSRAAREGRAVDEAMLTDDDRRVMAELPPDLRPHLSALARAVFARHAQRREDREVEADTERYQYGRVRGLKRARRAELRPITPRVYDTVVRPALGERAPALFEDFRERMPTATHVRLRDTGDELVFDAVGSLSELRPPTQAEFGAADAVKVSGWEAPEARAQAELDIDAVRTKRRKVAERTVLPTDDILTAVAKLGGLSLEEARRQGIDPAAFKDRVSGIRAVFTREGLSFDGAAELLAGLNFDAVVDGDGRYGANQLLDAISRALAGERITASTAEATDAETARLEQATRVDDFDRRTGDHRQRIEANLPREYDAWAAFDEALRDRREDVLALAQAADTKDASADDRRAVVDLLDAAHARASQVDAEAAEDAISAATPLAALASLLDIIGRGGKGNENQDDDGTASNIANAGRRAPTDPETAGDARTGGAGDGGRDGPRRGGLRGETQDQQGLLAQGEDLWAKLAHHRAQHAAWSRLAKRPGLSDRLRAQAEEAEGGWQTLASSAAARWRAFKFAHPEVAAELEARGEPPPQLVEMDLADAEVETAVSDASSVDAAAREAATSPDNGLSEPTDAQKEAGNYKKGHLRLHGLDISIENPAGTRRRPEWPPLAHHYGYIRQTEGADGDHVDLFIGPTPDDPALPVFVVDQVRPSSGAFDEHKALIGFADEAAARAGYLANYAKGWNGIGAMTAMSLDEFKAWLRGGDTTLPADKTLARSTSSARERAARDSMAVGKAVTFKDGHKLSGKVAVVETRPYRIEKLSGGGVLLADIDGLSFNFNRDMLALYLVDGRAVISDGASEVREEAPAGDGASVGYTSDDEVSETKRKIRSAARRKRDVRPAAGVSRPPLELEIQPGQAELFAPALTPKSQAEELKARFFGSRSALAEVGRLPHGRAAVHSDGDAAHIAASIRRSTQEELVAVVTGVDDRAIAAVRMSLGSRDGAPVDQGHFAASVARIPGAANVWFVHNHPSGVTELSDADRAITSKMREVLETIGVAVRGMSAVGMGGRFGSMNARSEAIPPAARTMTLPLLQSKFVRYRALEDAGVIDSPDHGKRVVEKAGRRTGLIVLDNRHRMVGFLPLSIAQMRALRGKPWARELIAGLGEMGGTAAIATVPDSTDETREAVRNLGALLSRMDFKFLDAITYKDRKDAGAKDGVLSYQQHNYQIQSTILRSVARRPARSLPVEQVRAIANHIAGKWAGRDWTVKVWSGLDDSAMPQAMRAELEAEDAELRAVVGEEPDVETAAYYDDETREVHLFASAMAGSANVERAMVREVLRLLSHEGKGHGALRTAFGSELDKILNEVVLVYGKSGLVKFAQSHGLDLSKRDDLLIAAEEKLAEIAEQVGAGTASAEAKRLWAKFVAWLRRAIARIGARAWTPSEADLIALMAELGRAVETGDFAQAQARGDAIIDRGRRAGDFGETMRRALSDQRDTVRRYSRRASEPPSMSDVMDDAVAYRDTVKAIEGGRKLDAPFMVTRMPDVLRKLELNERAIYADQRVITKALRNKDAGGKHALPRELVDRVSRQLHTPVMVFDSVTERGRIVVVTNLVHDGRPVVVALQPNGEIEHMRAHVITSIHPRQSSDHLRHWMDRGALRYIDQTQASPEWQRSIGLQLPKELPTRGSGGRVLTEQDVVKPRAGVRFSRQPREASGDAASRGLVHGLLNSQPADRLLRGTFGLIAPGKVTEADGWALPEKLAGRAVDSLDAAIDADKFGFLTPLLKNARAGLIDRYGLSKEYVARDEQRKADTRKLLMEWRGRIEQMIRDGMGLTEARALYSVLTGDGEGASEQMKTLAQPIREAIDAIGAEYVELGMLDRETYERNRKVYLPRSYVSKETNEIGGWLDDMRTKRRRKILGDQFKGRGIKARTSQEKLLEAVGPDWWGNQRRRDGKPDAALLGQRFRLLEQLVDTDNRTATLPEVESGGRKRVRRVWWPAGEPVPQRFAGYDDRGIFEARWEDGGDFIMWRDFTKVERERMGEITDARYALMKMAMQASHDLASGRMFRDIATNRDYARSANDPPDADEIAPPASYSRASMNADKPWTLMPEETVPGTGTKRWGALSGMYVRTEIWRDLNELDRMHRFSTWDKLLRQWKLNKTARNPVVHLNNVMSNLILADLADVRAGDLVDAFSAYFHKDERYRLALEQGVFGNTFLERDIKSEVMRPLLEQLQAQAEKKGEDTSILDIANLWAQAIDQLGRADQALQDLYSKEDELFRLAMFLRRRALGESDAEAALHAREQFLNYDIRAPWVNALRQTVLPFISYTYRAVPVLARSIARRPWKVAKYLAVWYALNAMAYALDEVGGDEEEERRLLRPEEQGFTWVGVPRMIRTPWRDDYGSPYFLDIRRWVPAGDFFDVNQSRAAAPLPPWLHIGGPLQLAAEFFANHQSFTGQAIRNPNDPALDQALDVMSWAWRSWVPSAPWVPGSWYQQKIAMAMLGARDAYQREYSTMASMLSSLGVKVVPHDTDTARIQRAREFQAEIANLTMELRQLERDRQRGRVVDAYYDGRRERLMVAINNVLEEQRETLGGPSD